MSPVSLSTKYVHIISLFVLLGWTTIAAAASYSSSSQQSAQHYISVSLDGGIALGMKVGTALSQQPRAAAGASVNYELRYRSMLFGVGAGCGFSQTLSRMSDFRDTYDRVTRDNDSIRYHYDISSYQEKRTLLDVHLPIYLGATFAEYMYVLAGAAVGVDVFAQYEAQARMLTAADFPHTPGTVVGNIPNYGYGLYPESLYATKASMLPASLGARLSVAPTVELGAQIPLAGKLNLRVGVFAAYRMMVSPEKKQEALLDLSGVNLDPYTQSQENLRDNLRLAPLAHTSLLPSAGLNNILVGIRLTLQIGLRSAQPCMCYY